MGSIGSFETTRRLAALLFALLFAGCATSLPIHDTENIDRVLALISQRLSYMDDVARNKWNSGAAIEDLPREREIIENLGRQAPEYGLDPVFARDFFRSQIEASKIIQRSRFAEWRVQNQPPFTRMPDLRDTIRPALDALTPELMKALAAALPALRNQDAASLVKARAENIMATLAGTTARDEAISPLIRISNKR